ncbi:MAG: hypothetical protein KGL11_08835 [Alphaproteobacteria bacterium]|nr:hypothetical protein [Alphaproteobacteria bacterium]
MEALFFVFALVGIVMVIHWSVVNDRAGNNGVTTGFFAMREPEEPVAKPKPGVLAKQRGGIVAQPAVRQRRGSDKRPEMALGNQRKRIS